MARTHIEILRVTNFELPNAGVWVAYEADENGNAASNFVVAAWTRRTCMERWQNYCAALKGEKL